MQYRQGKDLIKFTHGRFLQSQTKVSKLTLRTEIDAAYWFMCLLFFISLPVSLYQYLFMRISTNTNDPDQSCKHLLYPIRCRRVKKAQHEKECYSRRCCPRWWQIRRSIHHFVFFVRSYSLSHSLSIVHLPPAVLYILGKYEERLGTLCLASISLTCFAADAAAAVESHGVEGMWPQYWINLFCECAPAEPFSLWKH